MNDYTNFTNSELEEELDRLKREYDFAQKLTLENYQLMLELAVNYGNAAEILEKRTGQKYKKDPED